MYNTSIATQEDACIKVQKGGDMMKSKKRRSKKSQHYQKQIEKLVPYAVGVLFICTLYHTQFFQNFSDAQEQAYDKHVNQETVLSGIFDFSTPTDFVTLITGLQNYLTEVITGMDFTELYSVINDGFGFIDMRQSVVAANETPPSTEYKYKYVSSELDIKERPVSKSADPLVYIYNTHTSELYNHDKKDPKEKRIVSVVDSSNVVADVLEDNGIKSVVELRDVGTMLHSQGWNYYASYDASRMYLEDTALEFDSLEYFVDIHRDSVGRDLSTHEYKGKSYAKIMFVVGVGHDRYAQNLEFAKELQKSLEDMCPGITRSLVQKSTETGNGIYNQDFSPNTLLVEIGGWDNTYEEVENTSKLLGEAIAEFIASRE